MQTFAADLESAKCRAIVGLTVLVSLFMVFECVRTPEFGTALRGEWNLWTMAMASLEFLVAVLALTCAALAYYMKRLHIVRNRMWIVWLLMAAAFQYFVFDETLQYHERIGRFLRHSEYAPYVLGLRPHNMVEGVYFIFALLLTLIVIRAARSKRTFFRFYMAGVVLIGVEVVLGILPETTAREIYAVIPFNFPELFEMSGVCAFACAFLALAFDHAEAIVRRLVSDALQVMPAEHVLLPEQLG